MTYLESKEKMLDKYVKTNTENVWLIETYYLHLKRFLLAIEVNKKYNQKVDFEAYYYSLNKFWNMMIDKGIVPDEDLIDFGDTSLYTRYEELLEGVE